MYRKLNRFSVTQHESKNENERLIALVLVIYEQIRYGYMYSIRIVCKEKKIENSCCVGCFRQTIDCQDRKLSDR